MGKLADINAGRREAVGVLDRLGRPIVPGDLIVQAPGQQILVQVTDVRPQLDPSGPKGHIIHGMARFQFFAPPGRPVPDLLFVMRPEKPEKPLESDAPEEAPSSPSTLKPTNGTSVDIIGTLRRWFARATW